jgi:hypothetical protein
MIVKLFSVDDEDDDDDDDDKEKIGNRTTGIYRLT